MLAAACALLASSCLASAGIVAAARVPGGAAQMQPEGAKKERPAAAAFVGLTLEKATALAEEHGIRTRVVSVDGEEYMVTQDFLPERLNFTVVKGVVTKATWG